MKKILITGQRSYVGVSLKKWLENDPYNYQVEMIDLKKNEWRENDFSQFNVVFHAAAVVHKKESPDMRDLYFKVNRDLTLEVAKKAKDAGVTQFIFMSTMAVYGKEGELGKEIIINKNTPTKPKTLYGISKLEAEMELKKMADTAFNVVVLRPPMIYGLNCPGNYAKLEKIALISPLFPFIDNKRSMLHIDKLCQFVQKIIDDEAHGLYFPQDDEYINTSLMVKGLAEKNGKAIHLSRNAGRMIILLANRINVVNKIFGNLVYEKTGK